MEVRARGVPVVGALRVVPVPVGAPVGVLPILLWNILVRLILWLEETWATFTFPLEAPIHAAEPVDKVRGDEVVRLVAVAAEARAVMAEVNFMLQLMNMIGVLMTVPGTVGTASREVQEGDFWELERRSRV